MQDIEKQYKDNYYVREHSTMRVLIAKSVMAKARGLLGVKNLAPDAEALFLENCRAIHTVGMAYPIDIAFIDSNNRVIKSMREVKPGVLKVSSRDVSGVLERKSSASYWPQGGTELTFVPVKKGGGGNEDMPNM